MYKPEIVEDIIGKDWDLYIDGSHVAPSDGQYTDLHSPANGERIARIAAASEKEVNQAVASSLDAFRKWSALPAYERQKIMLRATTYVREQADRIGYMMALEQGKPFDQSRGEIVASCDTIDYYAAEGVRIEGYSNPTEKPNLRSWVIYQPVGVCAIITPWNYPVSLLSWKLGPALATGCTCVVKPSSVTPMSTAAFCMALTEGGIPAGVLNVLTGSGRTVGEALLKHPDVAKVAMTGSTETGKRLMEVFGPQLNKISLELGGHCPAVVCADADIENAAQIIAYKGFKNMGQSCSSVNRVYVHESKKDQLVARLKEIAQGLTMGDGVSDGSVYLGPMATKEGVEKALEHIEDAVSSGANLVYGGVKPEGDSFSKGNYLLPAILENVTDSMKVMQEETFGAVVPVDTFETLEEGLEKANTSSYGLVAYLFTKDTKTMIQASEQLEAGTVCVNNGAVNTNYAPYQGWKESGYGFELSRKAVYEYLNMKHIKIDLL